MKIIADSGSTKTAWYIESDKNHNNIYTQGINPFQQTPEQVICTIRNELIPAVPETEHITDIYFYGAGCTQEKGPIVADALKEIFRNASVFVGSDMLGAARGLCGHQPGIAAILGTGANSCFFDGNIITENVSPLGFILGDEGSGAHIGKTLVNRCLKGGMPEYIRDLFLEETNETTASIIQKVYREPMPNRYLASLSIFCSRHKDDPNIHSTLVECFKEFFIKNIYAYSNNHPEIKTVNFIGSIAKYYKEELTEAANELGYSVGNILQTPIDGLIKYHASSFNLQ